MQKPIHLRKYCWSYNGAKALGLFAFINPRPEGRGNLKGGPIVLEDALRLMLL